MYSNAKNLYNTLYTNNWRYYNKWKMNAFYGIIGNNIKTAREAKKFTQAELAENLDKTDKFISMLERGVSGLSVISIVDICKSLNIEPNTLFNGVFNYNDDKDKYIMNSLSILKNEDKEFLINVIEYVLNKNSK